jgi:sortase A
MPPKNSSSAPDNRDAAANLVRNQLDALYNTQRPSAAAQPQPASAQGQQTAATSNTANNWQQYHTQWQQYYQRYYEQYYVGHLHQAISEQEKAKLSPQEKQGEQLVDLRQKLLTKAGESAKKARKSRHFIPIASALAVVLVVAFLQYNQILIANVQAYVSPGAIDPQNIVVDPTATVQVGPEPKLIIPKINVNVPVIYGVGYDHDSQMKAMEKGVAHFAIPGANAVPGQVGNTVFSGHSSNDLFDPGDYKFIFAQLDKLQNGDTIYVNYNSVRYTYTVTKKEVVLPTQVDKLTYATDKPVLTLITCTPLGTAQKRLLVTAEQVAPDPAKAAAANTNSSQNNDAQAIMTGNGPSLLERLFGGR